MRNAYSPVLISVLRNIPLKFDCLCVKGAFSTRSGEKNKEVLSPHVLQYIHDIFKWVLFPLQTPLEASGSKSASLKSTTSSVPTTGTSAKLLTVYVPDSQKSHLVTKNVPLRNEAAKVRDVCVLMTHILNLSDPADFALFSIVDGKGKSLMHLRAFRKKQLKGAGHKPFVLSLLQKHFCKKMSSLSWLWTTLGYEAVIFVPLLSKGGMHKMPGPPELELTCPYSSSNELWNTFEFSMIFSRGDFKVVPTL